MRGELAPKTSLAAFMAQKMVETDMGIQYLRMACKKEEIILFTGRAMREEVTALNQNRADFN